MTDQMPPDPDISSTHLSDAFHNLNKIPLAGKDAEPRKLNIGGDEHLVFLTATAHSHLQTTVQNHVLQSTYILTDTDLERMLSSESAKPYMVLMLYGAYEFSDQGLEPSQARSREQLEELAKRHRQIKALVRGNISQLNRVISLPDDGYCLGVRFGSTLIVMKNTSVLGLLRAATTFQALGITIRPE